MKQVAIVGNGQLALGVARVLSERHDLTVSDPTPRAEQHHALTSGADVVIIATTTRFADVAESIETAITHGSHVIVSAEECAFPWAVNAELADRLDALARHNGVTVLGAGLNPGFIFDAFVVTLTGTRSAVDGIVVTRTVDLSSFGPAVRARLGLGVEESMFDAGVASGEILGHAGFPQSMCITARAMGIRIERIDTAIEPILADGLTVGVRQVYTAIVEGREWYRATFTGHLDPAGAGLGVRDEVALRGPLPLKCTIDPGVGAQEGSRAIIANSIDRVIDARAGWITVAELPPAHPHRHLTSQNT
ncbi:hypothetical protein BH10ACT7_BH10ACT7_13230 [soil metagenome]